MMKEETRKNRVLDMGQGVWALQTLHVLDGRLGLYPKQARGSTPMNCYLVRQHDESLLIETGYTVDEGRIIAQIEAIHPRGNLMSIFPMRVQEPPSMCNATSFGRYFQPSRFYAVSQGRIDHWANFHESAKPSLPGVLSHEREVPPTPTILLKGKPSFRVGSDREISIVNAPMRLIVTRWLFDHTTGTLFTSDMFSHMWSDTQQPRWDIGDVIDEDADTRLRRFLLGGRYWWLPGSKARLIRDAVQSVFKNFDVQNIAPTAGAILLGRRAVKQHVEYLYRTLDEMDQGNTRSAYISRSEVSSL